MTRRVGTRKASHITADAAAALVRSGMAIDYGVSLGQPDVFDTALAKRMPELEGLTLRSCLSMRPRAVVEADPTGARLLNLSWHFSGYDRQKGDAGLCHYVPLNLGEVPDYYRRFIDPMDMLVIQVCPMDEAGYFNFGPTQAWHRAIIERAKVVVVEVNRAMPYVFGPTNGAHLSEVDYVIDGNDAPLTELNNPPAGEVDRAVARLITAEIDNGACLQIGIGGMPNAVCSLLPQSGLRDLSIHTEMLTDGMIEVYQSGIVTGARKQLDPGKVVFTFAVGSKNLYAALDRNRDMSCCPVEYTNAPDIIMQNDKAVSINNTTQIDLQGQAASESDGRRQISGTGGQLQFVRGAYASNGGKSFICLASTYEKHGVRKSRIVLDLTQGNIVTTPRSDVMYVVTEHGIVNLKGKSVPERARALISLAHPDFRENLERQAYENRLIPRGRA